MCSQALIKVNTEDEYCTCQTYIPNEAGYKYAPHGFSWLDPAKIISYLLVWNKTNHLYSYGSIFVLRFS